MIVGFPDYPHTIIFSINDSAWKSYKMSKLSAYHQNGKQKIPGNATITSRSESLTPKGKGKRHKPTCAKQTSLRKHTDNLSLFPSEVIAMLKGLKNIRTKRKARLNKSRLVELTRKLYKVHKSYLGTTA